MEKKRCLFAYLDEGGDYSSCGEPSLCGGYFGTCHERSSRQETLSPLFFSNGTNTISANAFSRKKGRKKFVICLTKANFFGRYMQFLTFGLRSTCNFCQRLTASTSFSTGVLGSIFRPLSLFEPSWSIVIFAVFLFLISLNIFLMFIPFICHVGSWKHRRKTRAYFKIV